MTEPEPMMTVAVTYTFVVDVPVQPLEDGRPPRDLNLWDSTILEAVQAAVEEYANSVIDTEAKLKGVLEVGSGL